MMGRSRDLLARTTALMWVLFCILPARPAHAYIDPGTGSAVFSVVAPMLAMAGMLVIGVLAFGRKYVRLVSAALWRRKAWIAAALLLAAAATLVALVVR